MVFQVYVLNVSSVFSYVCCKWVYLDVAYAAHISCKCYIWMLRMFAMAFQSVFKIYLQVFSYACFKRFICLSLYVASVASGCFKSGSGVASFRSLSTASTSPPPPPGGG